MNFIQRFSLLTLCCLLWVGSAMSVAAQTDDDFDPSTPAEPGVITICYLTVTADPAEGATVNGGGRYKVTGGSVYISTSAVNTDDYTYTFQYWTLDGVKYSTSRNFYYTPTEGTHALVAHYEKNEVIFDPATPGEPSAITTKHYLYLNSNVSGACSFNIASGNKYEEGSSVTVRAYYTSSLYHFDGWSINGKIVSTSNGYTITMPTENVTLTAMFTEAEWDPDVPIEPGSTDQEDVDNKEVTLGDVDSDGDIDLQDLTGLMKFIFGQDTTGLSRQAADVNKDGSISIADAAQLISKLK